MDIWLVKGAVHSGKTGFLEQFATLCRESDLPVCGFLAMGKMTAGRRDQYWLVNAAKTESIAMARRKPKNGWIGFREFFFNPDAFRFGERIIREGQSRHCRLMILDEVGPLEMEGMGWSSLLDELAVQDGLTGVWTVRENMVEQVMDRWKVQREKVVSVSGQSPEAFLNLVLENEPGLQGRWSNA